MRAALVAAALLVSGQACATYSISACDSDGACGVAVATNNLAVGASVPFARANVGAVATQFETNPAHGIRGLSLLATGASPAQALAKVLAEDGNFEGLSVDFRQTAIVGMRGEGADFTGREAQAAAWAGGRRGERYAIIGNGLTGEPVLAAMEAAFRSTRGPLAARLLAALEAGQAAGGQTIGAMSAVLLVRTPAGGFADTDLRVDAAPEPVKALRHLFDLRLAHAVMLDAERAAHEGRRRDAFDGLETAMRLGDSWDRIVRRGVRLSIELGERERALRLFARFAALNPRWASIERTDDFYAPLFRND
ncbi:MAG TPA: DUF1028 domain-containing protein [Steroidobacteraceae bacterium]|nr:DUF1028 domain-containing protein [Steroidobacteraceae bacterium]